MNGVLIKTWEVHCAGCERPALGIGRHGSVPDAAAELREDGWGTRKGLWNCPACKDQKEPTQ